MNEEIMQTTQNEPVPEKMVIPLFELVVYPESRTKFSVDKHTGDLLRAATGNEAAPYAVGLTVRSGTRPRELTEESLYKVGNLFRIMDMEPTEDGYLIFADVVERVTAVSITERDGRFFAICEPLPDQHDIDADLAARILADIKLTIHETSSRFTGSEQFTRPIDEMDSMDQIMGFVTPFLPVNVAEKQALLEITSVRQRSITFLELLIRMRDTINIRIEMAKKVSDRVGKSNREAMLREQM